MKSIISKLLILLLIVSCSKGKENSEEVNASKSDFNMNWNFFLSEIPVDLKDLKNQNFRKLNLPHDWAVESEFDSLLHYDGIGTGFLPSKGYGYYQKKFDLPLDENQKAYVLFDGVYNNSEVYLNGNKLGFHPYGYSPFYYDLSKHLNKDGKENTITVKIDHSRFADSRWYTGAGIYRNVTLIKVNKLHIPVWGTFITTPKVSTEEATVSIKTNIQNDFSETKKATIEVSILDNNNTVVSKETKEISIEGNSKKEIDQNIKVNTPKLWDVDTPNLYTSVIKVKSEGIILNEYKTIFGIRSIKFDTNKGFFLNGKNMKIKGVCIHHDAGLVGTAIPKGVLKRRLQILKDGGVNALRISHNPASNELLDLADEMGLLVQDEFFDEWDNPKDKRFNQNESKSTDYITRGYGEHFQDWAKKDLQAVVLSHRNHPSIFQWSIGNEIEWTYPRNAKSTGFFNNMNWNGNYFWSEPPHSVSEIKEKLKTLPKGKYDIGKTAQKLSKWTKQLDTTRPITANCILPSSSHLSGYADALDIVGYSYRRVLYDYGHKNYPDKPIMGTENLAQWHEWKAVLERPHISGIFLWTGFDYMGEIREPWPVRVQPSGLLNSAGFTKGSYHMMKTLWSEEPHIFIATKEIKKSINKINSQGQIVAKDPEKWKHALWQWHNINEHWNYKKNEMVSVELYSNCEEIELFLNEKSLGKKKLSDFEDHIYKWGVPFAEGKLTAKGLKNGKKFNQTITTARTTEKIKLSADISEIKANNYDVAHIIVELTDANGNIVMTDDREITYEIEGPVEYLGVDNGWKKSIQKFQSNINTTHNGKTLLIVQAKDKKGTAIITAKSKGLAVSTLTIELK
jgi:hypothetical protein